VPTPKTNAWKHGLPHEIVARHCTDKNVRQRLRKPWFPGFDCDGRGATITSAKPIEIHKYTSYRCVVPGVIPVHPTSSRKASRANNLEHEVIHGHRRAIVFAP
jgi:hypothetical protein